MALPMPITRLAALAVVAAACILILDALWIFGMYYLIMGDAYSIMIENIQFARVHINALWAVLTYVLLTGIAVYGVVRNWTITDYGVIGFAMYGLFNCTNASIFTGWQWHIAVMDTAWGSMMFYTVGELLRAAMRSLFTKGAYASVSN